ncbi:PGF-pre-PGF domain-containing protein [uncultured Methanomethylovorans sp.]|uniref:PGF-pre-PGF domain-containing protein n=1 Tax=uncultured Methanomethylovorans sp. TaxID=183759 RepID=UPI002AA6D154|nr:PGF-pre-PGF domain-containing protein [uncultured Methanomethylovorans sp.]
MYIKSCRLVHFGIVLLILTSMVGICLADNVNLRFVSQFSGSVNEVTIGGNYAYLGEGKEFVILDISNLVNPVEVGRVTTPSLIYDITISNNYAYVADDSTGLLIIDISDPAKPSIKAIFNTGTYARDVVVSDNYAYVADSCHDCDVSSLVVMDISNPLIPIFKGIYNTAGNAESVAISNNYAYVADGDNGLEVLDIRNPAIPTLKGGYNTVGHAYDIAVAGNYAYLADGSSGFLIIDLTNPAEPTLKGSYETSGSAENIAISGSYAYSCDSSSSLVVIDFSNPNAPALSGSYDTDGSVENIEVDEKYAYVADSVNGLVILQMEIASTGSDTIPPASVTDLKDNTIGASWINWTWVNPNDADFSHAMVYLDDVFVTNTSEEYYNATGLFEGTTHTISIKTTDTSGNTNPEVVSNAATTASSIPLPTDMVPPASVTGLEENGTDSKWINWTWINPTDSDFSHVMVYIDGKFVANTTDSSINFYNATELSKGTIYTIALQTVDTSGNINSTLINDSATALKTPKVSNLSGTNITKNSITLEWEYSEDATQVRIGRDGAILGNISGSTFYIDGNLSSGKSYNYTLIPFNEAGLEGNAVSVILKTKSSSKSGGGGGSSSSKSSGGGSGGAVSVEDFSNLALKDVSNAYLKIDTNVTYEFTKEVNPIQSISFYSLKNSGQITSTVEVLNNKSKLANSTPEGSIYKYVNIWVGKAGFATASNIKDAQIKFKVNSSWIQAMGLNPEDVKLQRYNGTSWEVLPTSLESNDAGYVVYEAQTLGFSPFAITAEKKLSSPKNSEIKAQNVGSNTTSVAKETKAPGFGVLFSIVGLFVVAYLIRKS